MSDPTPTVASRAQLLPDKPAGAACLACPGRNRKLVPPRYARVPGRVQLAIVGEAPGHNEVRQGEPFVGASGKMMQRGLTRVCRLQRDHVHWTNAVLCDVDKQDQLVAQRCCAKRLRDELAAVRPVVIMPVGAYGLQSALGEKRKTPIQKWRGSVTPFDPGTGKQLRGQGAAITDNLSLVAPSVHPAFVMRSPAWGPVLEVDVARVARLLEERGAWQPPELARGRRLLIPQTPAELLDALAALKPDAPLGFDVETVGLGSVTTRLVCFALSDGQTTITVPWARKSDGQADWWARPEWVADQVTQLLTATTAITHNGPAFDHVVAMRYGLLVDKWDDTLLWAHAHWGHLPKHLAHVVTHHAELDVGPWKQWESRSSTLEELWVYNARDTLYTILAWQALQEKARQAA